MLKNLIGFFVVLGGESRPTASAPHISSMGVKTEHFALDAKLAAAEAIDARYLFDATTEYLALHRIAIPKYTTIQTLVSRAINDERARISKALARQMTTEMSSNLADVVDGKGELNLSELRQSAKSFTPLELDKELKVHRHIQPWMTTVNAVVEWV